MKNDLANASLNTVKSTVRPGGKILFANVPADGHFNPLTGLAVHLQQEGYDVRWYSAPHYEEKIRKLGISYYPFEAALNVNGENIDDVFPERNLLKGQVAKLNFDLTNIFILRAPEYYQDISAIRRTFPFDLLVADVAFSAIPLVKDVMGVPVISIGVFPLTQSSKDLAPAGLGLTPAKSTLGRARQALLRFVADRFLFRQPNRVMEKVLADYGVDSEGASLFDVILNKSDFVLQSGTPGFEYKRSDLGRNVRFIGALLPYQKKGRQNAWYDARLKTYSKVILVTQGTVEKDVNKLLVPTIEAFKNTDYLVIATTGGASTWQLRERFPFHNVIIEDFIPFADIMPYTDVYITNGGYGGVMLGIRHGLPMVVAGIHEGKNEINARVGYFKLGLNLRTETPKSKQIAGAVAEVMTNQVYREHVQQLSEAFARYDAPSLASRYVREVITASRETQDVGLPTLSLLDEVA